MGVWVGLRVREGEGMRFASEVEVVGEGGHWRLWVRLLVWVWLSVGVYLRLRAVNGKGN